MVNRNTECSTKFAHDGLEVLEVLPCGRAVLSTEGLYQVVIQPSGWNWLAKGMRQSTVPTTTMNAAPGEQRKQSATQLVPVGTS